MYYIVMYCVVCVYTYVLYYVVLCFMCLWSSHSIGVIICVCVYVCVCVRVFVYVHTIMFMYVVVWMYICVYVWLYVCMHGLYTYVHFTLHYNIVIEFVVLWCGPPMLVDIAVPIYNVDRYGPDMFTICIYVGNGARMHVCMCV